MQEGTVYGRHFCFILCFLLFFVFLALRFFLASKPHLVCLSIPDILIITFLVYYLFRSQSNNSEPYQIKQFLLVILYFLTTFLARKMDNNRRLFQTILLIFTLTVFCQVLTGFSQLIGLNNTHHPVFVATGTFWNPGPFGGFLVLSFTLCLCFAIKKHASFQWRDMVLKTIARASSVGILVLLVFLKSKASWLALITSCGFVFYCLYFAKVFRKSALKQHLIIYFFLFLAVVIIFYFQYNSARGRVFIWKITSTMILDHPVVGVGVGNYSKFFCEHQTGYFKNGNPSDEEKLLAGLGESCFNEYLQLTSELGIIGLLLFMLFIIILLRRPFFSLLELHRGNHDFIILGAVAGILGFLIFSLFSYPFSILPMEINLYFLFGIVASCHKKDISILFPRFINSFYFKAILLVIVFIFLVSFLNNSDREIVARKRWQYASGLKTIGNYCKAINIFKAISPVLKDNAIFLMDFGEALYLNGLFNESTDILKKSVSLVPHPQTYELLGKACQNIGNNVDAEKYFLNSVYLVPHRFTPRYSLIRYYLKTQQVEKAIFQLNAIIEMPIKVNSLKVRRIKEEAKSLMDSLHLNYN